MQDLAIKELRHWTSVLTGDSEKHTVGARVVVRSARRPPVKKSGVLPPTTHRCTEPKNRPSASGQDVDPLSACLSRRNL